MLADIPIQEILFAMGLILSLGLGVITGLLT